MPDLFTLTYAAALTAGGARMLKHVHLPAFSCSALGCREPARAFAFDLDGCAHTFCLAHLAQAARFGQTQKINGGSL